MIKTLITWLRHLRLQAAEADLQFLEARAPFAIAEQRALVARRRAALGLPTHIDTETVRRRAERNAKEVLL
ncbi:hypothetical protein [Thauera butanivorans]|uniref:hypothetical protein n=1 Tax=Thauera butanivorans TaxID=86174 RepID=UPI0008393AF8|nr:hypothetical protein [Thauera butanivorans]